MSQNQEITIALVALAQQILPVESDNHLHLAKQLLINIDPSFNQLINYCTSFASLKPAIQNYYRQERHQEINWLDVLEMYHDFALIGMFILDLALSTGKQNYIESILELPQEQQVALQPFVQQVMQRDTFIHPRSPHQTNKKPEQNINRQDFMELAQQNQKLKHQKEQVIRAHQDLKQNYDYLKSNYDKVSEELNYLKQERYTLINELGGSECGSVDETIDRVKRELQTYDKTVQKQQKQLQQKRQSLQKSKRQLQKFQQSFKANRYQQKIQQLQKALQKIAELQQQIVVVKGREEEQNITINNLKEHLYAKEQQVVETKRQLNVHEAYYHKYLSIKKLHMQFKSKIVKNVKELES